LILSDNKTDFSDPSTPSFDSEFFLPGEDGGVSETPVGQGQSFPQGEPASSDWFLATDVPLTPSQREALKPVRVRIPPVDIDSAVIELGISEDGKPEVPSGDSFHLAGWYQETSLPREAGPTVIAGHMDSRSGPSVFYRLREALPGDQVILTLENGEEVVFVVDAIEQVDKAGFPGDRVFGFSSQAELRLVTCGGSFRSDAGSYSDNLIVFAKRVF